MEYGLIGEKLGHSFSKEVHGALTDYKYELVEIPRDGLDGFMKQRDFKAVNVTIPFKEAVIPYLDYTDDTAKEIGAVNTLVNRDGHLSGYNTDYYGMRALVEHMGLSLENKKVAILGTGGTSKTARSVAKALGARVVLRVSRTDKDDAISYERLYGEHADLDVIINTTPVGMYPAIDGTAVDIDKFPGLSGVIDAVYNPIRTPLVLAALERGIKAEGGLYMLVAQAVRASEIFIDTSYPKERIEEIYKAILRKKENIVLIGMPSSGKSTVGKLISDATGRPLTDTDTLIKEDSGREIPDIFAELGEVAFRDMESQAVLKAAMVSSQVIATGGGAVLRPENLRRLKQNGRIYFIDRPLESLTPTDDRPLSQSREAIKKRYEERYGIYLKACDERIDASCDAVSVAKQIMESFSK